LDAGTIGSASPEAISTGMSERFGRGGSESGTVARSCAPPAAAFLSSGESRHPTEIIVGTHCLHHDHSGQNEDDLQ
jgi:hypothetical protein